MKTIIEGHEAGRGGDVAAAAGTEAAGCDAVAVLVSEKVKDTSRDLGQAAAARR